MGNNGHEEILIRRLKNNDENALAELIDLYGRYVYRIIYNLLSKLCEKEDMEEVFSDVFLAVWESRASIDISRYDSIRGYIGVAARNKAKNMLKKKNKNEILIELNILNIEDSTEQNYLEKEKRRIIQTALSELCDTDREIFIKYYYEYEKIADIAEELMMNVQTVKSRLLRGRKTLKKILEKDFSERRQR